MPLASGIVDPAHENLPSRRCPITRPSVAAWWLPGAHLPTIWGQFGRRIPDAFTRIERWTAPDGDSVSVARMDAALPDAPLLVLFHGLEGTVRSTYAQGLMHAARARGWGAAMLLWRTCDGRIPDVPRLYHSGETHGRRISSSGHWPPSARAGRFSASGFPSARTCSSSGSVSRVAPCRREVRRAVAISTPFDLAEGSRNLERGFSRVYVRHFVRPLKRKAWATLAKFPSLAVDRGRLASARTLWEFDDVFTGPVHGFAGAGGLLRALQFRPFP